jgi:hypothetical protein
MNFEETLIQGIIEADSNGAEGKAKHQLEF